MAVRHPPKNRVPPVAKRGKGRVIKYAAPDESFFRRMGRRIFRPPVLVALAIITTFTISIFGYYYWVFSARIDRLISGEIYTRSAGIYTAPRELRVGTGLAEDDLVARLKRANYVEKSQQADAARGRYTVNGASVDVEPGQDAVVDGQRAFPRVRVTFAKTGKGVAGLSDLDSDTKLQSASIEPKAISYATGTDR